MHQDFVEELDRIATLVDAGELPPTAIPRLFYFGHNVLYGIAVTVHRYKCIACKNEVESSTALESCPQCQSKTDFFDITEHETKWQCVDEECRHE